MINYIKGSKTAGTTMLFFFLLSLIQNWIETKEMHSRGIWGIKSCIPHCTQSCAPRSAPHFIKILPGFSTENYFGCALITIRHNNHRDANGLLNGEMIGVAKLCHYHNAASSYWKRNEAKQANKLWVLLELQIHLSTSTIRHVTTPLSYIWADLQTDSRRLDSTCLVVVSGKYKHKPSLLAQTAQLMQFTSMQWWRTVNLKTFCAKCIL